MENLTLDVVFLLFAIDRLKPKGVYYYDAFELNRRIEGGFRLENLTLDVAYLLFAILKYSYQQFE